MIYVRNVLVVLFLAGVSIPATAESGDPTHPATYETVLIPLGVHLRGSPLLGANGSKWVVDLEVYNPLDEEVLLNQHGPFCFLPSGCETESGFAAVLPRTIRPFETGSTPIGIEGALLHVQRTLSGSVRFQLRLLDTSRADENLGTEIPVVREAHFVTGRTALLNVRVTADARVALRIYDPSGGTLGQTFRVVVLPDRGHDVLFQQDVALVTGGQPQHPGFPPYPGYAELFSLEQRPELAGYERVRIEIEPLDPSVKYWAMASITNNSTQMVTIVSPQ